jgi:hypothetical protein
MKKRGKSVKVRTCLLVDVALVKEYKRLRMGVSR